ncbi:hypothetical protein C2857_004043 [Epichloe festucae Fl1]|uniref:Probable beta-glucosidase btgE n=1 Tax=Epichloe festucae (strain Fl1) TaxID=877507 RepID=A0A7S9PVM2_EPIFF|nr:hypothetical protein C2857_004043 [Epichloe festucae Fl1]
MKGGLVSAALAAMASGVAAAHHRHAHEALFKKSLNGTNEICTPVCTTVWTTFYGEPTLVDHAIKTQTVFECPSSASTQAPPPPTTQPTTQAPPPATTITVVQTAYVCPAAGNHTIAPNPTVVSGNAVIVYPTVSASNPGTYYTAPEQAVTVTKTAFVTYCPHTSIGLPTTTPAPVTSEAPPPAPPVKSEAPPPAPPVKSEAPPPAPPVKSEAPPPAPPVKSQAPPPAPPVMSQAPPPAPPVVSLAPPPAPPVVSLAPPPPVKSQAPPPPAPPVNTPEAPKTQPKPETPKQSSPPAVSKGLTSNNDHFGITYTPYKPSNGNCKTASEVDSDIKVIKSGGFTTVRVYSTDCNTLDNVGNACKKYGVDMIVGVFVKASGCDISTPEIKEQVDKLAAWNNWDLVRLVVVGNEAIMNGFCSPQQLQTLVTTVKSRCRGKYQGHYTISETLNIWQREDVKSAICGVVDVTGANIHPYFNALIAPSAAGQFVQGQLDLLGKICPGNNVINLECGYPLGGKSNGLAVPGLSQQAEAVKSIRKLVGDRTVFFDFESNLWKAGSSCDCEDKWGLASAFNMNVPPL